MYVQTLVRGLVLWFQYHFTSLWETYGFRYKNIYKTIKDNVCAKISETVKRSRLNVNINL